MFDRSLYFSILPTMTKIGINSFAVRQTEDDFVGTKLSVGDLQQIRNLAEEQLNKDVGVSDGYADFCKLVTVKDYSLPCPIAKITPENVHRLVTQYRTRRDGELPFLSRKFPKYSVASADSHHLTVVLYTLKQLMAENGDPTGADYDLICVNAEADELDSPMTPDTIIRNHLGKEFGGSGVEIDKEKYTESVEYWSKYAMIDY